MNQKRSLFVELLLAFLLPTAIFLAVLFHYHILPFGELTLLFSDLDSQYVEFMAEYRRILLGQGSFSWSWHAGLGLNFVALIAYYLASPFNFLLILFPEENLPLAVSVITVLKLGFAGTAFTYYLRKRCSPGKGLFPLWGTCYALSAYVVGYAFNLMWLDALILLPLLCVGIDRLFTSEKCSMTGLTLLFALSFTGQFYMAWMTGLFCVLYFFSRVLIRNVPLKRVVWDSMRFAICVGTAAGLSAFLLLPTFFVLKNNMSAFGQSFPDSVEMFCFPEILQKLFLGSFDGIKDSLPHIYCGIPALIGLVLYFTRKRIPGRERIISGALCVLLLFSFWFAPLDFFWHALDHPSWFPYRYAFVFIFWVLSLACDGFSRTESHREVLFACMITLALFALSLVLGVKNNKTVLLLNLLFLFSYAVTGYLQNQRLRLGLGTVLVSAELFLSTLFILSDFSDGYTPLAVYRSFHDFYRERTAAVLPSDGDFYRMEKLEMRNYNDPLGLGFPGVSHFSSTASTRQTEFLKRLGFNCYATWCSYQGATSATDALLGIRYEFGGAGKQDSLVTGSETWLHPAQFPLFFFIEESFARYDFRSDAYSITRLNDLLCLLDGMNENDYFVPVPVQVSGLENLTMDETGTLQRVDPDQPACAELQIGPVPGKSLYLFLPGASLNVTVSAAGDELMNGNRDYAPFPICLDAYVAEGDPVTVRLDLLKDHLSGGFSVYSLDTERLFALAAAVSAEAPRMERSGETSFLLTAEASDKDRLIVSSIPFDAGWRVNACGKRLPLKMIHESVLGFILPAGVDSVSVDYRPYGQEIGLILSGSALLVLILIFVYERKKHGYSPAA